MIGECLCGAVAFEITGHTSNFYQCHCPTCRKVSGSACNTALLVSNGQFKWLRGEGEITKYSHNINYKSHFCRHCGSPLPNTLKGNNGYWVPAGLINDKINNRVSAHVYTGSKANWDIIPNEGVHFTDKPDLETLYKTIERTC